MYTRVPIFFLIAALCWPFAEDRATALFGQQTNPPTRDVRQATFDAKPADDGAANVRTSDSLAAAKIPGATTPTNGEHPLTPVLKWAKQEVASIEKDVADYSATIVSRERVDGKLSEYGSTAVKIRHRPLSIYAGVLSPEDQKGNEAIYVEGRNDGKLLGHTTGFTGRLVGTVSLDPAGSTAMKDQRHPITELGMLALCRRLVQYAENDIRYSESNVRFLHGAKVEGRPCNCIEIVHPVPRANFQFHIVRLFVDEQLKVPVRYEQYDWPAEPGAAPELVEEYTYVNVKLNNGFGDSDFDVQNPNYAFP